MAIGKKSDCVILGLLSHEDLTGYEIKKRMDTALKYFWGGELWQHISRTGGLGEARTGK